MLDVVVPGAGALAAALASVFALCGDMKEGRDPCSRLAGRLRDVVDELRRMEALGQRPPSQAVDKCARVVGDYLRFLQRYAAKSLVSRVVRHGRMMDELLKVQEDVVALFRMLNLAAVAAMMQWKSEWEADRAKQQCTLAAMAENDALVLRELQGVRAQTEAVMLLRFEMEKHAEQQTSEAMGVMRTMAATVVRATHTVVKPLPPWYVPAYDVEYEPMAFAQGSFGSVHRGVWGAGTRVVVKCLLIADTQMDERAQQRVESEISIWHKLNNHPNIIKMFGASHVSDPPFIVCEDAVHGNLGSFLVRVEANKRKVWRLLYQAALGLDHVHKNKVVHGDLKLNNILVGADGMAKLSDFGLSAVRSGATLSMSSASSSGMSGGLRWRAPECLRRRPTFASDVYSLAMCIIEAFLGEPPFAFLDDDTVREAIRDGEIPERPDEMDDDAWDLVITMTVKDPAQRCSLGVVLERLKDFAEKEKNAERIESGTSTSSSCSSCFWEVPSDFSFCSRCGTRVADCNPIMPEPEVEDFARGLGIVQQISGSHALSKTNVVDESLTPQTPTATLINMIETATETAVLQRALLIVNKRGQDEYWDDPAKAANGIRVLSELAHSKKDFASRLVATECLMNLLRDENYWTTIDSPTLDECSSLIKWLYESDEKKQWAVQALPTLCMRPENRVLFAQAGAIAPLVKLLRAGKKGQTEWVLAALSELAVRSEANSSAIIQTGALPLFLKVLMSGTDGEKANAALVIGHIVLYYSDSAIGFVKANVIAPLVGLLRSGAVGQSENAAFALANLADKNPDSRVSMVKLGTLRLFVAFVRSGTEKQKEWSAVALGKLASKAESIGSEIVKLGGVPPLVELLHSGTLEQKSRAACALAELTSPHRAFQDEIAKAGAIPLLVVLLRSGTDILIINACNALAALAKKKQVQPDSHRA